MSSQVNEQGVINKGCTLDDLGIVLRHFVAEALTDGPQAGGFRRDVDLLRKIGAVNDERQALQRDVTGKVLVDELLKRAPPALILMRISRARCVEADGILALLYRGHFVRLDERDLRTRIDESPDQPRRRRAIDVNL